ncbi:hypothetical protein CL628_03140 [bacterium]|nr:hypothetical protein [bacterium]
MFILGMLLYRQRGQARDILLVISGEFGCTPKINGNSGRDHWAPLTPLALAGGGLRMGQTVGESSAKGETPKTSAIRPQDLMATIFQFMGMDGRGTIVNQSGRPVFPIEDGHPIAELV